VTANRRHDVAAKKSEDNHNFPIQAELARLDAEGVDIAGVIALLGYIGPSPKEGVVRLHPRLGDLSVSIDIDATSILATREAPATALPLGGVIVWVSRTADVTFRRTRTVSATALQVKRFFGASPAAQASSSDPSDRLNIRVRPDVPPVYECDVCTSKECGGQSHCLPPCTSPVI
jgi:hypothetical protein